MQIVITGTGLACSLGLNAEQAWQGVLRCQSVAGPMPALESAPPADSGGYQAMDLPADFAPDLPRESRYLRWSIRQAMAMAHAEKFLNDHPHRCGIVLGTTLHGMRAGGAFLRTADYSLLSDFVAGSSLQRASEQMPFAGDALTTCSACSSSLASIALAVTILQTGRLDLVVAGGYDTVSEYAFAGFNSLRLVTAGPLRPFAEDRKGMKLGDGYGIVVLERLEDAQRRGVQPIAEIVGCGESSDAHHLTQPHPAGEGAAAAIGAALSGARIAAESIGLIAAHATGTPDNDAGEYNAYAAVFGSGLLRVPAVAFKSHVGHTLGGAGAVELILSALALRDQIAPATMNTKSSDVQFPNLSLITDTPRPAKIDFTLNTSLGFGGANTCIVLTRPKPVSHQQPRDLQDVFISGIGVILPGAIGNESFANRLTQPPESMADTGNIPEEQYIHLLNARRVRRMSDYVKLTLAASTLALNDAGVVGDTAFASSCSAILGTAHAGAGYCVSYYQQIIREGMAAANPMLFAEGVPNAAAAHVSLMLSLKGLCQTVIGSRTAGLDALRLAFVRIASGQWQRAIVSAGEEFTPIVNNAYAHCFPSPGTPAFSSETQARRGEGRGEGGLEQQSPCDSRAFAIAPGAVTLILESKQSLKQRQHNPRARILACAGGLLRPHHAIEDAVYTIAALQKPRHVITSANGSPIDRLEAAALSRGAPGAIVSCMYGYFPETFSAGPLSALAAALLAQKLPALARDFHRLPPNLTPATGAENMDRVGVLSTGFNGTFAGATIALGNER